MDKTAGIKDKLVQGLASRKFQMGAGLGLVGTGLYMVNKGKQRRENEMLKELEAFKKLPKDKQAEKLFELQLKKSPGIAKKAAVMQAAKKRASRAGKALMTLFRTRPGLASTGAVATGIGTPMAVHAAVNKGALPPRVTPQKEF